MPGHCRLVSMMRCGGWRIRQGLVQHINDRALDLQSGITRPRSASTGRLRWPREVTLVEVGPRDGLQNEPSHVPTAIKVSEVTQAFILILSSACLRRFKNNVPKVPMFHEVSLCVNYGQRCTVHE